MAAIVTMTRLRQSPASEVHGVTELMLDDNEQLYVLKRDHKDKIIEKMCLGTADKNSLTGIKEAAERLLKFY